MSLPHPEGPYPPTTVLIVGAGEFGAMTALSLVKGPYAGSEHLITILDRSPDPPAVDAASSDYNKIIRQDYADPFYAKLACGAMTLWRTPEFSANFFESGVVVLAKETDPQAKYVRESLEVNLREDMRSEGRKAYGLKGGSEVKGQYRGVDTAPLEGNIAYMNDAGGWANSRGAVVDVLARLRILGVRFAAGEAAQLLFSDDDGTKDVHGVQTVEGESIFADFVVLATGAWTSTLLPEELAETLLPTGQVVGTVQLSLEELSVYRAVPVTLMLDSGFYCFPPTADGVVKFAIHDRGWLNPAPHLHLPSIPRTTLTPGFEKQEIPPSARVELQKGLARLFPQLAHKPFTMSRLCWYSDRPSGDFLLDYHPKYPSLFIASGGSGHAFKFLPVLGDLIVGAMFGRLSKQEQSYFSFYGEPTRIDKSRGEQAPVRKLLPQAVGSKL